MAQDNDKRSFTDRIGEPLRNAGEAMRASTQKVADNTQQLNLKIIDQAEQNAREAFNALRAAANARSFAEVMEVQSRFIREQTGRGMEQIREVGELIARF